MSAHHRVVVHILCTKEVPDSILWQNLVLHVCYTGGLVIACERQSERFQYTHATNAGSSGALSLTCRILLHLNRYCLLYILQRKNVIAK